MKIVLALLSDIHFMDSSVHPVISRVDAIASAIGSAEAQPEGIVLVFSGDIANTGSEGEYAVAERFIVGLSQRLSGRFPGIGLHCLSAPGNHDLYHPPGSEGFRKTTVNGSIQAMRDPKPNLFYLEKLLEPQKQYWEFAQKVHSVRPADKDPYSRICTSLSTPFQSAGINFNLLNTAILSQRDESQGSLLLPLPLLDELLPANASPGVTITVMHHPTFWIESATLTGLREVLARIIREA